MYEQDAEIIKDVLAGELSEFGKLIDKYKGKIAGIVYSYLGPAEDIEGMVQEVFMRGYKQLPTLENYKQFASWIVRIARNLCIDHLRRRREETQSLDQMEDKAGITDSARNGTPLGKLISEENLGKFSEAFDKLDSVYREVLTLKSFCGLSYNEIEKITGLTKAKVGELLFKARKQLKVELEKLDFRFGSDS